MTSNGALPSVQYTETPKMPLSPENRTLSDITDEYFQIIAPDRHYFETKNTRAYWCRSRATGKEVYLILDDCSDKWLALHTTSGNLAFE
jgi:hypothetical protein